MQTKNNIKKIPKEIIFDDFQKKHRVVRDYSCMNMWDFPYVRKGQTIYTNARFKPMSEEIKKGYELFFVYYDKIGYKQFKCTYYYLNAEEKKKGFGDSSIGLINNTSNEDKFLVPKNAVIIKRIRMRESDYYKKKGYLRGDINARKN